MDKKIEAHSSSTEHMQQKPSFMMHDGKQTSTISSPTPITNSRLAIDDSSDTISTANNDPNNKLLSSHQQQMEKVESIGHRNKENTAFCNPSVSSDGDNIIKNDDLSLTSSVGTIDVDMQSYPTTTTTTTTTNNNNNRSSSNTIQSDDSNGATTVNSIDCKRHQVEKALGFLEIVRKKYSNEPSVYNGFLNLMRSFKTHRLSDESNVSLKEVVDKVKNIFVDNRGLFDHFSEFVIGDKPNENIAGLVNAANNMLPSISSLSGQNTEMHSSFDKLSTENVNMDHHHHATTTSSEVVISPKIKYEPIRNAVRVDNNNSKSSSCTATTPPPLPYKDGGLSLRSTTTTTGVVANELSHLSNSSLPTGRITAPNSLTNHSPRVISSIQHNSGGRPPMYSHPSSSSSMLDGGIPMNNNGIRSMYTGAPGIPPPPGGNGGGAYRPPYHNPSTMNPYVGGRRLPPPPIPHHNMVHVVPMMSGGNNVLPPPQQASRDVAYGNNYRTGPNLTPSNNVVGGRRFQRPPSNFTALQSALYHNITTTSTTSTNNNTATTPGGGGSSSEIINKPQMTPSKRPYNYTSSNSKSSSNEQQSNSTMTTTTMSGGGAMVTGNQQQFTQDNMADQRCFASYPSSYIMSGGGGSGGGGAEFLESFDRGAFDFVSAVKMYFTDVLKKPRLYQDFVHHLREYQMQHEMVDMSTVLLCEEKKVKENELLKKLMDNVYELFNQNVELINSFLHYLPSLNNSLSTATLAPYHATLVSNNKQPLQVVSSSLNDPKMNTTTTIRPRHSTTTTSSSIETKPIHYSSVAMNNNNSIQKSLNNPTTNNTNNFSTTNTLVGGNSNVTQNVGRGGNPYVATTYPTTTTTTTTNNTNNTTTNNTNNNKQTTKPPAISTARQIPQSRVRAMATSYGGLTNSNQCDPNFILQIFTEIRAVTNVKDYTNILKCINLYNGNIVTFTELLYLIKSITYNNKIAYSKMRIIFKSSLDSSQEFDGIFPEIFYPGSEMLLKNNRATPTANSSNYRVVVVGGGGAADTDNQMLIHNQVNPNRMASSSRHTPNQISSSSSNMSASGYYGITSTGAPASSSRYHVPPYGTNNNTQPPRAQRIATTTNPAAAAAPHMSSVPLPNNSNVPYIPPNNNTSGTANYNSYNSYNGNEQHHVESSYLESCVLKKTPKYNAFIESLSETQHARFYLDRNRRVSSSYFLLGASTPTWKCSGMRLLDESVLNTECLSEAHSIFEEKTTNTTTPATFTRNLYEEELTRVEEERFELDVLHDLMTDVCGHLKQVLACETHPTADDIFGEGDNMKYFLYKTLQNLYGDHFNKVVKALKLEPVPVLKVVIPRFEQKIKEWHVSKLHLEDYWRRTTTKNYLKALDYSFQTFKSADLKKIKAKQFIKEIELLSSSCNNNNTTTIPASGNGGSNKHSTNSLVIKPTNVLDDACSSLSSNKIIIDSKQPHLSISYNNKLMVLNASHLIMYYAKRQSGLTSEDKGYLDHLMNSEFLPKFFNTLDSESNNKNSSSSNTKNKSGSNLFHFYASDDLYVFFRLHSLLCDRLHKIYEICKNVMKASELHQSNTSSDSNLNLSCMNLEAAAGSSTNYAEIAYHYPFLLSKSIQHRFSARRRPKSLQELYEFFIELAQDLLDGTIDSDFFEDECRFMFGTECYIIFTIDKIVQECVKYLNFMVFNAPSQNLIELFINKYNTTHKQSPSSSDNEYKREMDTIMKPQHYYYDFIFNAVNNNDLNNSSIVGGVSQNCFNYVTAKIFLYQLFVDEPSVPTPPPTTTTPPHPRTTTTTASTTVTTATYSSAAAMAVAKKITTKDEHTDLQQVVSNCNTATHQPIQHSVQKNIPQQLPTTISDSNHSRANRKTNNRTTNVNLCDFDGGANYCKSILTDVNFDDWRSYVSYFTSNDVASIDNEEEEDDDDALDVVLDAENEDGSAAADNSLKPLNDELNFAREKRLFMVRNIRQSFKRLPSKSSQIIGLIKHLYTHDPSSDSVVFDSSANINNNVGAADTTNNASSNAAGDAAPSTNRSHINPSASKIDQYSNGLVIFDNETYALEPVAFKMQFLRDSYYFIYNKCSNMESMSNYYSSTSSLSPGEYLESIVCRNIPPTTTVISDFTTNHSVNVQSDLGASLVEGPSAHLKRPL